jgi:hypothetical protein
MKFDQTQSKGSQILLTNVKFNETSFSGSRVLHADRQTDRHGEAYRRTFATWRKRQKITLLIQLVAFHREEIPPVQMNLTALTLAT